ncbi:hypothetical protein [Staphylococcus aureus]|nr:hypothetical protein [Staphylococcus aureus]
MVGKARKKPVEIEYMQYIGSNKYELYEWSNGKVFEVKESVYDIDYPSSYRYYLNVETLEGFLVVSLGDYIVKGVEGEFYPVDPDIFEKTYEVID